MIAHDLGPQVARGVAQELVVYYRRPGGQSQFSALLAMRCCGVRRRTIDSGTARDQSARHRPEGTAMKHLNIGEAAAAAGVTPKMVRHYESLGMIPEVQRTEAGYRLYSPREVAMLRFIRQSRALGFSVKQIESLLALWRDEHRASREVKELAQQQLDELELRQREIDEMRATLSHLVCLCKGDDDPHCAILEELSGAEPAASLPVPTGAKTLKQVRAGTKVPARKNCHAPAADAPAHAALSDWTRGLRP
jgi:MerR family copper efflux transcriptional regulator